MKIWVNDDYLGTFKHSTEVAAALAGRQKENGGQIFYLFACGEEEYSFGDSWEEFLQENIGLDVEVKIMTAAPERLRLELVGSTQEYLERLAGSLEGLATQFYAGPDQSAWEMLADFLEGLDFICQALKILEHARFDQAEFNRILHELLQAMESKDLVAVADLLAYEWSGWLEQARNYLISPSS